MQENRQYTHKNVTQDIPWEEIFEGKTQPPKASITMDYSTKYHYNTTIESFKAILRNPCKQAWIDTSHDILLTFTNAPLANVSSLVLLDSFPFCLLSFPYNNYPYGCLYSSKSHKITMRYYISHALPSPLTPHLILEI